MKNVMPMMRDVPGSPDLDQAVQWVSRKMIEKKLEDSV